MTLFSPVVEDLVQQAEAMAKTIETLPLDDQIEALNCIRIALHEAGPYKNEPVDCVLWLEESAVVPNGYNPNAVMPPEMRLLKRSIEQDGMTQPVVGWNEAVAQNGRQLAQAFGSTSEVVDGAHRTRVCKELKKIKKRLHGRIPVTIVRNDREGENERMASTIRHNRARGVHGVLPMTDIVEGMLTNGMTPDEVAAELGMDADEVLRFMQNSGLPSLFKGHSYSKAWE